MSLKHGFINATHTSNVTIGWTPATLPMPFPIVIISSSVSLILAFIGWKTAASTWVSRGKRTRFQQPEDFKAWSWRRRFKWSWTTSLQNQEQIFEQTRRDEAAFAEAYAAEHVPLRGMDKMGNTHESHPLTGAAPAEYEQRISDGAPIMKWEASMRNKILVLISVVYNTIRTAFAFKTTLELAIARSGTHPAVSSLFLLYLSFQTFISNRKLPRLLTLIVVLDLTLVAAAFLVSTWDFHAHTYGDATVRGGNCPVYANNCTAQAHQWTQLGCGAVLPAATQQSSSSSSPNPNFRDRFYPPYGTGDDFNLKNRQNTLSIIERVVGACGTFWVAVTLPATLYEAGRVFLTLEGLSHLLWPIPTKDKFSRNSDTGKVRRRIGWAAMHIFAAFALPGAFVVTVMSVAGHVAGETRSYEATFVDGLGPAVAANVTFAVVEGVKVLNATAYGGNATSWSDCFTATTVGSRDGFFKEWLAYNEQVAFRLVSLL